MLDLCSRNQMVLGNTWYRKQSSHKFILYNWHGEQGNWIDLKLLSNHLTKALKRCRSNTKCKHK